MIISAVVVPIARSVKVVIPRIVPIMMTVHIVTVVAPVEASIIRSVATVVRPVI
jgi:hypothetical protein